MADFRVVMSFDEAVENIRLYNDEIGLHPRLAARIKQHPAWYADKDSSGEWRFGPSKFIGYHGISAKAYLASYSRKDGRETEPALREWFSQVDPDSILGKELRAAFVAFAERHGKTPNANWRVSVASSAHQPATNASRVRKAWPERIAFDPEICGGRARIAGTRMRVSDIVEMLADGATREEIVAAFPYISDDDITAALVWAARSVDHLVLRAA